MQKISPFLWFADQAEEAANFYVSVFKNSRIVSTSRYAEGMALPAGSLMTVSFILDGEEFTALNGGPLFEFTSAISFVVSCDSQEEVDYYWEKLTDGGEEVQCGWLTDRFGLSWQVVPIAMNEMLGSSDRAAAQRATQAMLKMKKLDLAVMRQAFEGE
jgi:predicted 3-demethylubiquinone-9 3-methyltransferase (glyoxalase superfamily)